MIKSELSIVIDAPPEEVFAGFSSGSLEKEAAFCS